MGCALAAARRVAPWAARGMALMAVTALTARPAPAQEAVRVRVQLPAWRGSIVLDTLALRNRVEFDAAPASVWPALAAAVRGLDPALAEVADSTVGLVAGPGVVAFRRLAGDAMSRWLDCGTGMTGPQANTSRVTLAFAAILDPLPGNRSRLGLALTASALDRSGSTSVAVQCNTFGTLEAAVIEATERRLGLTARR